MIILWHSKLITIKIIMSNKLNHIANYYNLSKRKLKKDQLIDSIVQFENNPENSVIVYNRKKFWHYLTELKNDSYFGKFVIFN